MSGSRDDLWTAGLSVRAANALLRAGYTAKEQIMTMTDNEIYRLNDVGLVTLVEIRKWTAHKDAT